MRLGGKKKEGLNDTLCWEIKVQFLSLLIQGEKVFSKRILVSDRLNKINIPRLCHMIGTWYIPVSMLFL